MNRQSENFLKLLRAFLWNTQEPLAAPDWEELCRLAKLHNLIPAVYCAARNEPSFSQASPELQMEFMTASVSLSGSQFMRTQELFNIYEELTKNGIRPLLLKGLVCRSLYSDPDSRCSCDEDLWIQKEDLAACDQVLRAQGYTPDFEDVTPVLDTLQEVTYENGLLTLEIHLNLFGSNTASRRKMNQVFENSFDQSVTLNIQGHSICSLNPTEHYLFLFLHLYKHFSVGGAGIRHVMDLLMFWTKYKDEIDSKRIQEAAASFGAELFYSAVQEIGRKYLGFGHLEPQGFSANLAPLLDDIIANGCFGNGSRSQRLGSTYVLSRHAGQDGHHLGILTLLFPPARFLHFSYPFLVSRPWLLPYAWLTRLVKFAKELLFADKTLARESIRHGRKRLKLLKKYKIF